MNNIATIHTVNILRIQYLSIIGSFCLLLIIFELIRRKRLREQYALLWLGFAIMALMFSFWRAGLEWMASLIGIAYPPMALLLFLVIGAFLILMQYSLVLSRLNNDMRRLTQEHALLAEELRRLRDRMAECHNVRN